MKIPRFLLSLTLLTATSAAPSLAAADNAAPPGFTCLFNGKDLTG